LLIKTSSNAQSKDADVAVAWRKEVLELFSLRTVIELYSDNAD
jgi:hypothetical protein